MHHTWTPCILNHHDVSMSLNMGLTLHLHTVIIPPPAFRAANDLCMPLPSLLLPCAWWPQDAAVPGPSCSTSADGTCTLDLAAAARAAAQSRAGNSAFSPLDGTGQYTAVVTAEGHGPLVVPSVPNSARYVTSSSSGSGGSRREYVATLVLDRKLVKPGDDLHVTGVLVADT
jgi:hypothetical protein